jgi:hypothetical protein
MKFRVLFFLFLVSCNYFFSQDSQIVFDRPGISDSPYIVDSNRYLVESGIFFSNKGGLEDVFVPSILLRKYIFKKTEVRFSYNCSPQMMGIEFQKKSIADNTVALGLKHKLHYENDFFPEISFMVNTYFPTGKLFTQVKNNGYFVDAGFQFQSNINDYVALNYNVGTLFNAQNPTGIITYSLCMNTMLIKDVEFFGEFFGYSPMKLAAEIGFDGGVIYYPNSWSQLDFSLVHNRYLSTSYLSLLVGYSFCFDTNKRLTKKNDN